MVWGVTFSIGFLLVLAYYVYRQAKDPGATIFPQNAKLRKTKSEV